VLANLYSHLPTLVASDDVECNMAEYRHIGRSIVCSYPAFILTHGHVNDPMQRVLNTPMRPDCNLYPFRTWLFQTTDVVSGLLGNDARGFGGTLGCHFDDGIEIHPIVFMPEPGNDICSAEHFTDSFLYPAMAFILTGVRVSLQSLVSEYGLDVSIQ
jgi:hypothetical protein